MDDQDFLRQAQVDPDEIVRVTFDSGRELVVPGARFQEVIASAEHVAYFETFTPQQWRDLGGTIPDDFDAHYDPETGTASVQAEYGDRPDLSDATAVAPVERGRIHDLAERIREWFHRDRDQGMGL
jgi:hypothetical protein